jgi:hypothetical protein
MTVHLRPAFTNASCREGAPLDACFATKEAT